MVRLTLNSGVHKQPVDWHSNARYEATNWSLSTQAVSTRRNKNEVRCAWRQHARIQSTPNWSFNHVAGKKKKIPRLDDNKESHGETFFYCSQPPVRVCAGKTWSVADFFVGKSNYLLPFIIRKKRRVLNSRRRTADLERTGSPHYNTVHQFISSACLNYLHWHFLWDQVTSDPGPDLFTKISHYINVTRGQSIVDGRNSRHNERYNLDRHLTFIQVPKRRRRRKKSFQKMQSSLLKIMATILMLFFFLRQMPSDI